MKFGAAQSARRVEDIRVLRVDGRCTGDIARPGGPGGPRGRRPPAAGRWV